MAYRRASRDRQEPYATKPLDGDALFREFEHGRFGLLPREIALILEALGAVSRSGLIVVAPITARI